MYRGQGVPNAIVMFTPADDASEAAKRLRPFAYADGQGNFELKTYRDGDGAPLGKYRVSVMVPSGTGPLRDKDAPAGEQVTQGVQPLNIPPAVSKKYGSAETSGIEVTVQAGENNLEPFVLTMGTASSPQAVAGSATSISSKN